MKTIVRGVKVLMNSTEIKNGRQQNGRFNVIFENLSQALNVFKISCKAI